MVINGRQAPEAKAVMVPIIIRSLSRGEAYLNKRSKVGTELVEEVINEVWSMKLGQLKLDREWPQVKEIERTQTRMKIQVEIKGVPSLLSDKSPIPDLLRGSVKNKAHANIENYC